MYFQTLQQFLKTLRQLDTWLERAEAHAETKGFDSAVLLQARLAPDQFPCVRQVQIACDTVRVGAARVTGREMAERPDTERTVAELRSRVAVTLADCLLFTEADFADISKNTVTQPRWKGQVMSAHDYFLQHVLPNFYFHATTAYAILRHNGVPLGKKDFLGERTMRLPDEK